MTADLVGLADCPWCKGQPQGVRYRAQRGGWYAVECICGARGPEYDDAASAITAWNTRAELRALAGAEVGGFELEPVERDEEKGRDYIPLPGGWEVQTKGTGSTFRLQGPNEGDYMPVTCRYLQEMLPRMAYDIRAALTPPPGSGRGGVGDG